MDMQTHSQTASLPTEETVEAIAIDEALWNKQFAATSDDKLTVLIAAVEAKINVGNSRPMFDEHGNFVEQQ